MLTNPLFSVLIANFNNGKYIKTALESVLNQTYKNWEIIIVDDFSNDESKELLKSYSDHKKIKIFYNNENKGCGFTKKRCIDEANGEVLGFLDPDDKLSEIAIERMVASHILKKDSSLVYSNHFVCDENLKVLTTSSYQKQIPKEISYLELPCGRISHFATFKRNLYENGEKIDESFKRAVDQDLYYKLEEVGNVSFIDIPLYYYRIHDKGISLNENINKAFAWSLLARINACKRRNISIEEIIPKIIEDQSQIRNFYENSMDYRLGKLILNPLRCIKKIMK